MTFRARPSSHRSYTNALDAWRSSSELVRDRWHQFRIADRESRPSLFAAYVVALDREEAAAAELALFALDRAA